MKAWLVGGLVAVAIVAASGAVASAATEQGRTCPAAWRAGWQKLADRIGAPVYCPTWMPNPLDGQIGGQWQDIDSVDKDRSYLISFLSHDQSGDVHVNFRGYPGRVTIPKCTTVDVEGGKTHRGTTPCFADNRGTRRANGIVATFYAVNQDADQWHLLYAWRHNGSLYTVSEHYILPYSFKQGQVKKNLDRLLSGLVLVRPRS
ncbi:MAG TPA: hypothetical protein VGF23_01185 [Gaiellaceae bacterium]|jgi:hypothetical protein